MAVTRALAETAPFLRRQFGAITARQLGRSLDQRALGRLVDAGVLERTSRGVYRCVLYPETWEQRALLSQFAGGPRAVVSHGSAARILGLRHAQVGPYPMIELTFPRGARVEVADVRLHESVYLDPDRHVVRRGPFRVTSPAWTIAALGHRRSLDRLERMIDAVIADGDDDITTFHELGGLLWNSPGVVNLRAAVARHLPAGRLTRSERERRFLRILRDHDLPLPAIDVKVRDASGRTRYLDFAYLVERVAIEIDAHPDHHGTIGRRADGLRQNDLVPAWTPLRFDEYDLLYRPGDVARQVRRALDAARAVPALSTRHPRTGASAGSA